MPEFPDWTEFCSNETEHRGLDPLGLESVGASIVQNQLLPGITNATRHIRYYSFFSWVFWKFWSRNKEKAAYPTSGAGESDLKMCCAPPLWIRTRRSKR